MFTASPGPFPLTVLSPVTAADVRVSLTIIVTSDGKLECSGPVTDENLCLLLLEKAKERIRHVHRGPNTFEIQLPS